MSMTASGRVTLLAVASRLCVALLRACQVAESRTQPQA